MTIQSPTDGEPGASHSRAFITEQRVRFGHIDPAGIAYFPRIFNFVHEAFEDLWGDFLGVPYDQLIGEYRIGFPTVHIEADFKHGLHFGDRPVVEVTCRTIGHSSVGFRYRFRVEGKLCVEVRATHACIDLDTMRAIPIAEAYREGFKRILDETDDDR